MTEINSDELTELKECQLCHQMLPKSLFYKRKDRDGNYTWIMSYCGACDNIKVKESRSKNPEYYKEYGTNHSRKYYNENKDKVQIIRKRYYYNNLLPEKQIIYKQKLLDNYPDIYHKLF